MNTFNSYVYTIEFFRPELKANISSVFLVFALMAPVIAVGLARFVSKEWTLNIWLGSGFCIISMIILTTLPESPRYLEAKENKLKKNLLDGKTEEEANKESLFRTLINEGNGRNIGISIYYFTCVSFSFYLLSILVKYVSGDPLMNIVILAFLDIIGYALCTPIYNCFGLKKTLVSCFLFASIFSIGMYF
jgi:Na+/melibiose symporter-like transporter